MNTCSAALLIFFWQNHATARTRGKENRTRAVQGSNAHTRPEDRNDSTSEATRRRKRSWCHMSYDCTQKRRAAAKQPAILMAQHKPKPLPLPNQRAPVKMMRCPCFYNPFSQALHHHLRRRTQQPYLPDRSGRLSHLPHTSKTASYRKV